MCPRWLHRAALEVGRSLGGGTRYLRRSRLSQDGGEQGGVTCHPKNRKTRAHRICPKGVRAIVRAPAPTVIGGSQPLRRHSSTAVLHPVCSGAILAIERWIAMSQRAGSADLPPTARRPISRNSSSSPASAPAPWRRHDGVRPGGSCDGASSGARLSGWFVRLRSGGDAYRQNHRHSCAPSRKMNMRSCGIGRFGICSGPTPRRRPCTTRPTAPCETATVSRSIERSQRIARSESIA